MSTIAIVGATGFVGTELCLKLLDKGFNLRILSRHPKEWPLEHQNLKKIKGDIKNPLIVSELLEGVDTLYYLVHGLQENERDFEYEETKSALTVLKSVQEKKIKNIIYLGGLGPEGNQSPHLRSRHIVGEILGSGSVPCLEFRASIVLGAGSLSFEMMKAIAHRLPIRPYAPWLETLCQPIGVDDLIKYLISALEVKVLRHQIVEIGSQEVIPYGELLDKLLKMEHLNRPKLLVSKIEPKVMARLIDVVVPEYAQVGRKLFFSLQYPTVVTTNIASDLFPDILPESLHDSLLKAKDKSQTHYPPLWGAEFWKELMEHYQLNPETSKDFVKRTLKKFDLWNKFKGKKS
jgi:uncharacterized protein YbjT (DUF2867 family)